MKPSNEFREARSGEDWGAGGSGRLRRFRFGCPGWETVLRAVLAVLVLLKFAFLLTESQVWEREDPVIPGLPMWGALVAAIVLEGLVFVVLGERDLDPSWKQLALVVLLVGLVTYRISGMILNGPNLSGCGCFGVLGRWLTGHESTVLAWGVLGLFGYGAWRYRGRSDGRLSSSGIEVRGREGVR